MDKKKMVTIDGNTAAAHIAYAFSEVAAIYPITPSSPMGEYADSWASTGKKNLWGKKVEIVEMQSEAGAAGAVHGALAAGALTTTFTASQGLLLMIPNMYKIAGEMTPTVFHVSARSLAAQSLSIFGDHSDVMACRNTGFAMTAASSIQETEDMALVAQLSTLKTDVPFLAFFDGFRTSHEYQKVEEISYEDIKPLVDEKLIQKFRARAQRPEHPMIKVAAQNEDVYFQGRETVNPFYEAVPQVVEEYMGVVSKLTGRPLHLFTYTGAKDATDVIIVMGSGADTCEWASKYCNEHGSKTGVINVHLYRPFSAEHLVAALPKTVKRIAVLDRTKEPGALGEPLYLDVVAALSQQGVEGVKVIGGRYGLSSKDFPPTHAKAVFEHLAAKDSWHNFTVGINDDVTGRSIKIGESIDVTPKDVVSCMFWGLGSDGTVGANKNSIKIIGNNTPQNAQAYFSYDSKKSGGITVSHLRFGESKLNMPWLIDHANFVACHNAAYIGRYDMLSCLNDGGVFLLNSQIPSDEVFDHLTAKMQEQIITKHIRFYNINALEIAEAAGLGTRINTVMQAAFFKISAILPEEEAISLIKTYIEKTFLRKGESIVKKNWAAVDGASDALHEVKIPAKATKSYEPAKLISDDASEFAKDIILPIMHLEGNSIPVSKMSYDGKLPSGTAKLEKRGVSPFVPEWDSTKCIQCNQCVQACPHAAIRAKQIDPANLDKAPVTFKTLKSNTKNDRDLQFKIQVFVDDCQGCGVCVEACPTKALDLQPAQEQRDKGENDNLAFFESQPYAVMDGVKDTTVKGLQFKQPLFEFSGACAGCGETPYVKLVSQICGENMIAANATGCSSIYSGTYPTIPYTTRDSDGRGPAWGNSLFEDNAEYGLGMRMAVDSNRNQLKLTIDSLLEVGTTKELTDAINKSLAVWGSAKEDAIQAQNEVQAALPAAVEAATDANREILTKMVELQDYFCDKNVFIIGGDGWAYDIGYGGVDHAVASGKNINILVLDTEVYSNTGGQASKATPIAAVAKFANSGKQLGKKNLGFMCMSYGYVYVASIALGANRAHAQKALQEAVDWNGPSIVFCYSSCINHGMNMRYSQLEAKKAVDAGYWPLYRYNPALEEGKKFNWDIKKAPTVAYQDFLKGEVRYTSLYKTNPEHADELFAKAEEDAKRRMSFYEKMGEIM